MCSARIYAVTSNEQVTLLMYEQNNESFLLINIVICSWQLTIRTIYIRVDVVIINRLILINICLIQNNLLKDKVSNYYKDYFVISGIVNDDDKSTNGFYFIL